MTRDELVATAAKAACIAMGDDPEREGPWLTWYHDSAYVQGISAALSALEAAGFAIVPLVASEGIVNAGSLPADMRWTSPNSCAKNVYREMIQAAQEELK